MLWGTINIQLDVSMFELVFFSLFVLFACLLSVLCYCVWWFCMRFMIYVVMYTGLYLWFGLYVFCVFIVMVLLSCKSDLMSHVLSVFLCTYHLFVCCVVAVFWCYCMCFMFRVIISCFLFAPCLCCFVLCCCGVDAFVCASCFVLLCIYEFSIVVVVCICSVFVLCYVAVLLDAFCLCFMFYVIVFVFDVSCLFFCVCLFLVLCVLCCCLFCLIWLYVFHVLCYLNVYLWC